MRYTLKTDDEHEHLVAVKGWKYKAALHDLDGELREAVKYGDDQIAIAHAEVWRSTLRRILGERDLALED